jgi:hypothetical protein
MHIISMFKVTFAQCAHTFLMRMLKCTNPDEYSISLLSVRIYGVSSEFGFNVRKKNVSKKCFMNLYRYHKTQKFNAEFESVEKSAISLQQNFAHSIIKSKTPFFFHVIVDSFFRMSFLQLFNGFEISIKFCDFRYPNRSFEKNLFF